MKKLTAERLLELEYVKKIKENTHYFQKGEIIIVYREEGVWEYCADGNIEVSGGMRFINEEDLNNFIRDSFQ